MYIAMINLFSVFDTVFVSSNGAAEDVGALLVSLVVLALGIGLLVWVYKDAKARGLNASAWVFVVFLFSILGLVIYLHQRPKGRLVPCPACHQLRPDQSWICPHCHSRISPP